MRHKTARILKRYTAAVCPTDDKKHGKTYRQLKRAYASIPRPMRELYLFDLAKKALAGGALRGWMPVWGFQKREEYEIPQTAD